MQDFIQWIQMNLGLTATVQTNIFTSAIVILLLIVTRRIVLIFVNRKTQDIGIRYRWRKTTSYITFGLAVLIVGSVWFRGFQSLTTYLGLVSAGIAIALQTPLVNLAGWFFIIWRRPFIVGDRIEIGTVRGDVIDQRIFMFSLMEIGNWVDAEQSTGRVIHVPNGKVFSEPLANYTDGFQYIWNEIPVLITFESNWQKAKEILFEVAGNRGEEFTDSAERQIKQAASKMMIYLNKLTPIVYTTVKDHGVMLTMRYLCNPRRRRGSEQEIWEDILTAFGDCPDIDFAYPTQRHYLNHIEGKEEARAKAESR
ncbi:MAG: mechanosensitive ion channel family protein [Pyrinomonadaceae bacterium]|nr:mechanosensitive ion channel family protein [Pyrinomonadaceae bacterium]